jgi:hypothetical protein
MSDVKIQLETGRWTQDQTGTQYGKVSGSGAMRVSQTEPQGLEMSRAGLRFMMGQSAALTGIAPVQAMPTTAAQWVIWNPSLTKALVFDRLGAYTTSGVAGAGSTVVVAHVTLPVTSSTKSGITIASMSGSTATSVALINSGVTVTSPAAPAWHVLGTTVSAATAALNVAVYEDVDGKIIVPPLRGLGLCVIAPTGTTPLYAPIAQWTEIELDLE